MWPTVAVLALALAGGCAQGPIPPDQPATPPGPDPAGSAAGSGPSQVRVPRADYSNPASVAAAFYVAWASYDAAHDPPDAYLTRCADLVTPALRDELARNQPASAAWRTKQRIREVSLVRVQAIVRPYGAPAPTPERVYYRIYAERTTTSSVTRTVTSDGISLQLVRLRDRWLVNQVLFY